LPLPNLPDCPTCRSSSYGKCATHRDEVVFRDRYFITVDLDPETEANIRADERHSVLDEVVALVSEFMLDPTSFISVLERLRPSKPRRK
jgi:hypothetical protein